MLRNITGGAIHIFSTRYNNCARGLAKNVIRRTASLDPDEINWRNYKSLKEGLIYPNYLARLLDVDYRKGAKALEKHPELSNLSKQNVVNSIKALKKFNYTSEEICARPMILFVSASTINNRYCALKECGVEEVTFTKLVRYITIMNKSVATLKTHQVIPYDVDVFERLRSAIEDIDIVLETQELTEKLELKQMRRIVLTAYLKQRLDMSDADIEKTWGSYARVRQRSFRTIQRTLKILLEDFQFTKERIVKNAFLLYADDENLKRILQEIPTIGGQNIRYTGYRRPKILMSSCDALLTTLKHIKSFGINDQAVKRCLEVLTLGPDTVLERLNDLKDIEEFQVLTSNPRVLRLVHYQNKARLRLEYLNQLKIRCASLHILSCGSEAFERFTREGSDRTKGRDIVVYLSNVMQEDPISVRNALSRHPNWCHIPSTHVKQVYEFLLQKKFSSMDIYQNIHLLLYPIERLEEKFTLLYDKDVLGTEDQIDLNINTMSNSEILTLVLYLIEFEFHFTGDGIWMEQHTHQMENFNNLLPNFPHSSNKVYKYGVKPTLNPKKEQQINQL